MRHIRAVILSILVVQGYSAPQFITFQDGKLGVNFGGYHAGVGIGGGAGKGVAGGLYAEAGTPHGQLAKAGLGGSVDGNSGSIGGLFAGATAGGNVRAAAGLGGVAGEKTAGSGFAAASSGRHEAASGLGGESSISGSSSFKFSGTKSLGIPTAVIQETEVVPLKKHEHKVHTELKLDATNEIGTEADAQVKLDAPAVIVKEVYVEPQPKLVEKTVIHTHYKPSHHHHKTAYVGGYIGGEAHIPPPPPAQKRVDIGVESSAHADIGGSIESSHSNSEEHGNGGQITYKKEITFDKNQNFFRDIFNIPISTLQAVGNLLSNTAAGTSVKVEKTASIDAESDITSKHDPHSSPSSSSSSDAHISVQTPSASKFFDDIFAIPINTLGAVNKFLENNVSARKRIQVSQDGDVSEPARVRLGPHARRRANKRVVIVQENPEEHKEKLEK